MEIYQTDPNSGTELFVQHLLVPDVISDANGTMVNSAKKRRTLTQEGKEIVLNVLEMCEAEKAKGGLLKPFSDFTARAAVYAGVTEATIRAIQSEDWKPTEKPKEVVSTQPKRPGPKKKNVPSKEEKTFFDDRNIIKIKDIFRDYCIENCKIPTVTQLLPLVLNKIPIYETNAKFLWRVLHSVGYRRKNLFSKKAVLVENPEAIASRDEYLQTIRKLRDSTENVFYIYECIIDRSYTFFRTWMQKYSNNNVLQDDHTYLLICAASENGFLNAATMFCKPIINECKKLCPTIFENWLKDYLIPNLPTNSIVVMDDAPHHCTLADKPIPYVAPREDMIDYLKKKNIKCEETMRRIELYMLIEQITPQHKIYIVDDILKEHQFRTMRLPPFMIDLNPAQLAMDEIQQKLYETEYNKSFNLKNVRAIMLDLMTAVTKKEWKMFFAKTQSLEDVYWMKDCEFETAMDKILENLQSIVDSESEKSSTASDCNEDW